MYNLRSSFMCTLYEPNKWLVRCPSHLLWVCSYLIIGQARFVSMLAAYFVSLVVTSSEICCIILLLTHQTLIGAHASLYLRLLHEFLKNNFGTFWVVFKLSYLSLLNAGGGISSNGLISSLAPCASSSTGSATTTTSVHPTMATVSTLGIGEKLEDSSVSQHPSIMDHSSTNVNSGSGGSYLYATSQHQQLPNGTIFVNSVSGSVFFQSLCAMYRPITSSHYLRPCSECTQNITLVLRTVTSVINRGVQCPCLKL